MQPRRSALALIVAENAGRAEDLHAYEGAMQQTARLFRSTFAKYILAFVALCAIEKAVALAVTGLNDDEAYTLVIARALNLSYFDHPPLHQWILHAFVSIVGETRWARVPFWLMFVATNVPLFGLTRRIFGDHAALWALFAFNAMAYFLLLPDGFILPDAPMLLFLATGVWAIAEILFAPPDDKARPGVLWLIAGLAFGCAGLSKYSAVFVPIGLLGFLLGSPRHRHWLFDARAYAGGALGLATLLPALVWNYQNHWISFAFQIDRAGKSLVLDARAWRTFGGGIVAQVVSLSPWIGAPIVISLARAWRADADSAQRFLLWLVLPPVLLFAIVPLFGQRAIIPHWFNVGWLFAFPLVGRWLATRSVPWLRIWAGASAALACLTVIVYLVAVIGGPARFTPLRAFGSHDPTRYSYDWPDPSSAAAWRSSEAKPPAFVVIDDWRVGGRVGTALGPRIPICAFSSDPRGFAYACPQSSLLGQDALIVVAKADAAAMLPLMAAHFEHVDPSEDVAVGRGGAAERILTLAHAHVLLRPYELPYGPANAGNPPRP